MIRRALSSGDTVSFDQITAGVCKSFPGRTEKILQNAAYLKTHIEGISICTKDPAANNGGCTEPHVSHAGSPMDVKKMIVAQLISAVRVSRNYRIEIDFRISERQLGLDQEQQAERKPKQKKRRSDPAL